jgi:hypothetical protein
MKLLLAAIVTLTLLNTVYVNAQELKQRRTYFLTDKFGKQVSQTFSYLDDFYENGLAVFAIGGNNSTGYGKIEGAKYGIINKDGKIVLPSTYDYMYSFGYSDTLFAAQIGENKGIITAKGKLVVPISFMDVDYFYNQPNLIKVQNNNEYYQLYNVKGEVLTPFYEYFDEIKNGFIVQQGGYKGVIDNNFKLIVPTQFRRLDELKNGNFLVQDMFLKYYIIDGKGNRVGSAKYDYMDTENSSNDYDKIIGFTVTTKGKQGFLDANLTTIVPPIYKDVNKIDVGCDQYIFAGEKKDGEWYLLDSKGKQTSKEAFQYVNTSVAFDKYLIVEIKKKEKKKKKAKKKTEDESDYYDDYDYTPSKYKLVDLNGKAVLEDVIEDYTIPYSYNDEGLLLIKSNGKWIGYNENLTPIIKTPQGSTEPFTYLENVDGGLCIVQIGGKDEGYGKPDGGVFGVYNDRGEQIIPLVYEDIENDGYGNDMLFKVKKAGKLGLLSANGSLLTEPLYSKIDCSDGACIVTLENQQSSTTKYGVIDANSGKVLIPIRYDYMEKDYGSSTYIISNNNKFGTIDKTGNTLLKPKYTYIKSAGLNDNKDIFLANIYGSTKDNGYGMEVEGGNWGVINKNGDTLTPFKFKEIEFENDSILQVLDLDGYAYLMQFPSLKVLTDKEANYIDEIGYSYENKTYLVGKEVTRDEYGYPSGGVYGLSDQKGNKLADYKYAEIKSEGSFIATYQDFNGFDLMDKKGKILIQNAQSILPLNDSLFFSQKDGKYAIFNSISKKSDAMNGVVQVSMPEYFYGDALIGVKDEKGKWGLINELGSWLIKPSYCDIIGSSESFVIAATCTDGVTFKYGVIDANNTVLIPFEYDSIEESYDNEYKCVQGKKLLTKNLMNETLKTEEATDENIR